LYLRSFAPWKQFGGCALPLVGTCIWEAGFGGDDRSFTTSLYGVTSRITAKISARGGILQATSFSDPSHWGPFESVSIPRHSLEGNAAQFRFDVAGHNPLVPGAPDIDLHLNIKIERTDRGRTFSGDLRGDAFPSAEIFVTGDLGGRPSTMLHTSQAQGGPEAGPLLLFGDNRRSMGIFYQFIP
jgi:hypothetical protein